jgi:hypothetical protein
VLCEVIERSQNEAARAIRRQVLATAQSPKVVAAAAAGLTDDDLALFRSEVLEVARANRHTTAQTAMAQLIARLGTPAAFEELAELLVSGFEETAHIALRTLCVSAPEMTRSIVYANVDPWEGRHWSVPLHLEAGELLQGKFPGDVAKDMARILKIRRLPADEAFKALRLLEATKPTRMLSTTDRLFSEAEKSAAVVAYACECLHRIDPESARALALQRGIASRSPQRRLEIVKLLRADHDEEVTEALRQQLLREKDRNVRAELAGSLIAPGRTLSEAQLDELIAQEHDEGVLEILKLARMQD